MTAAELPTWGAWRHLDVREGFEVVFLERGPDGYRLDGHSTGVEDGEAWAARYALELDASWRTRTAHVLGRSARGAHEVRLAGDGAGGWLVDGRPAPELAGCLDVDLEASACTNALPVRRLALQAGEAADAPAAYVRALDLAVERLEQRYARLEDEGPSSRYDYASPRFGFEAVLAYDEHGLVLDYPGIAVRVG